MLNKKPHPDLEDVISIVREAAYKEILPRFQKLKDHDIREKNPGDLVTTADLESERHLKEELMKLLPGSIVVGEEETERKPELINRLLEGAPTWVLDPVDGTRNFAHGRSPFTVIVALCYQGETLAGWIYDPITDEMIWAYKGEGAYLRDKQLEKRLRLPVAPLFEKMKGSLSSRIAKRLKNNPEMPQDISRVGCVGRDYMDLALGNLHFARYAYYLKPWDHAAGVLIHTESGGYGALVSRRTPYEATLDPSEAADKNEVLLFAPNQETWERLHNRMELNS